MKKRLPDDSRESLTKMLSQFRLLDATDSTR